VSNNRQEADGLTIADHYDAELRRHNEHFRLATGIVPGNRVLDVGCGAGQSTREAARAAVAGTVLGVDVSAKQLERARRLAAAEGLRNVTYELADAEVHDFRPDDFDAVISRFGTMFFRNPVAAFRNLARASRRDGRLVMMVWQAAERNEWAMAIHRSLAADGTAPGGDPAQDPFSLGDPSTVAAILQDAGFGDTAFLDVHEPVYYGPDVETAYGIVRSMKGTSDLLAPLGARDAERALERLRAVIGAHATSEGVLFDSRAWIVRARRRS
jgi:SAM-dependent methyltransferase